jgi:hemerythrin-like metal-binding protein
MEVEAGHRKACTDMKVSSANTQFEWSAAYSVGNLTIDLQRKKFMELCAQAARCQEIDGFEGREMFHVILHELAIYAKEHLVVEEAVLKAGNCPKLVDHLREHEHFRTMVTDFLFLATQKNLDKAGLARFLSEWWEKHFVGTDLGCKPYFSRAQVN